MGRRARNRLAWSLCTFVMAVASAKTATAAIHDTSVGGANFRIYVPDGAKTIRGVVTAFNGSGGDLRAQTASAATQAVMKSWSFAFLATGGYGGGGGAVLQQQLEQALATFADASRHPELINAPLVLTGFSLGGGASCQLAARVPGRVIAFIPMRGSAPPGTLSATARKVPGLFVIGSGDSGSNMRIHGDFTAWRGQGAQVGFAIEWVAKHTPAPHEDGTTWGLAWVFASEAIRLRYPRDRAPTATTAPVLDDIGDGTGWLATHTGLNDNGQPINSSAFPAIAAFADYAGNKSQASWLPSQAVAHHFRAFIARDKLSNDPPRNTAMKFTAPVTTAAIELTVVEGGKPTVTIDPRGLAGIDSIELYSGASRLARLEAAPWTFALTDVPAGIHGLTVVATAAGKQSPSYETYLVAGDATFGTDEGKAVAVAPSPPLMDAGAPPDSPGNGGGTEMTGAGGQGGAPDADEAPPGAGSGRDDDETPMADDGGEDTATTSGCSVGGAQVGSAWLWLLLALGRWRRGVPGPFQRRSTRPGPPPVAP